MERRASELWWDPKRREGAAHEAVDALCDRLIPYRDDRTTSYELYRLVYSDCPHDPVALTTGAADAIDEDIFAGVQGELTLNVTRMMCASALSRTVKSKPLPTALTKRGDWKLHTEARRLAQYIEADFDVGAVMDETARAALDALVYGTGIVVTFEEGGDIVSERAYPGEFLIDPAELGRRDPLQLVRTRGYDREHLISLFPKHEEAIRDEPAMEAHEGEEVDWDLASSDIVAVREAWRRPSGYGKDDGRHFLGTKSVTFVDEKLDRMPTVRFIRWQLEPGDFWGRGLVAELLAVQGEINRLSADIQEALYMNAHAPLWFPDGCNQNTDKVANIPGVIIKGGTTAPQRIVGSSIDPDVYAHLDRLWGRAFQLARISEMQASGIKPPGLDSGKALRAYADMGAESFAWWMAQWERLHLDVAKDRIAIARGLEDKGQRPPLFAQTRTWAEPVELPELAEEQYRLRITPISALSETFAGKLNDVENLIKLGVIQDPMDVRRLLSLPDPEADNDLQTAPRECIEWAISRMLYDEPGSYIECEPEWDAALASKIGRLYIQMVQPFSPPRKRVQWVREFVLSAEALLATAAGAAAPPPAADLSALAGAGPAVPPLPPGMPPAGMPAPNVPPMGMVA